ncbi:cholesterol transporter ABCA5-like [Protopterus annectens]|uniref:cholesterol transporter ABCA5-like n=1 Tax=Protopterus annectens TaxID=7888 RepID=UPI001CFC2E4D|nr:cholesterol transporter ABCA5-like [Protopterus annectens]
MEEIRTDDMKKMSGGMLQDTGVLQQTRVLLYKNVLTKWRNKTQLLQELVLPLFLLCLISIEIPTYRQHECDKINSTVLGKLDEYNYTGVNIGYTPVDNATKRIMEKVAYRSFMNGTSITGYEDESSLQKFLGYRNETLYRTPLPVGIVFKNKTTYHLRLTNMPKVIDHLPVMCYDYYKALDYWEYGFVTLQATIDAAIIEENTNHSVWEELLTMEVAHKESPDIFEERNEMFILMVLIIIIYYLPFVYSLSSILVAEKKRLKDLVVAVDLKSSALWLSWGILYGGFMFIMSVLISVFMTVFATSAPNRMWFPLFLMFFLHGLSQMFFTFMLSSLFKKTKIARMNGALTVAIFGILGLSFMDTVPTAVGWMLCLVFPWTFCIGFSQINLLEETLLGATFSNLTVGPYPLVAVYIVYIVDCIIYLMLALFFDHIESGEHGLFLSIFYFIRDSCYRKPKQRALSTCESIRSYGPLLSDKIEPVPSELSGKEVIRINNIKKTYRVKNNDVKALRGLSFDVYEGQIMALLGHSGSGKTTLMNILSGTCKPSEGKK